jgi:hypothetical protein
MKATYITFLLSIILISCISYSEPLTDGPDNDTIEEHNGLLTKLVDMQVMEQKLFNRLTPGTDAQESSNIVSNIKKIATYRNNLFDKLLSDATAVIDMSPEMEKNNILFGEIKNELGKMKHSVSFNKTQKFENMKMAEINNYYNERSKAYVSLFKFLFYCSIPLLILSVLINRNILPNVYGNILIGIVLLFTIVWGGTRYYDIISRDNMNFNEYAFDGDFNTRTAPAGFSGPAVLPGCIDEACCNEGTIYDKSKGVCVIPSSKN